MDFGKSQAKVQMVPDTGVTFSEVAGCDGAKLELAEVVDFLKKPEKYSDLGARIPRGKAISPLVFPSVLSLTRRLRSSSTVRRDPRRPPRDRQDPPRPRRRWRGRRPLLFRLRLRIR